MKLKRLFALALPLTAGLPIAASAQIYPLTENTFSNPEFVKRFTGSYGFDLNLNPQITREESELFQEIAPQMQSNPQQAIQRIQSYIETAEAAPDQEISAAVEYTLGSLYLQQGDHARAQEYYRTAIRKFPNFFRAYQNLGLSYIQQGQFEEALPHITSALRIGGGSGTLYGLLGYAHLNTGRTTAALDSYRMALIFEPDSRDWRLGKLQGLLRTGQTSEAVAMLNDLLTENPTETDFWMQQANAYMGQQEYLDAAANLELVSRLGGATPDSLLLLGDLYVAEGLEELAVDTYTRALEGKQVGVDRLLRVVESLSVRQAPAEAERFLNTVRERYAEELSGDQELLALNLEARLALAQGERERAADILNQVVSRDPMNGKALITLGDYHRDSGDLERAEMQYERATRVDDTRGDALLALGRLKVQQREYRAAIDYLQRAQAVEPRAYIAQYIDRLESALRSTGS